MNEAPIVTVNADFTDGPKVGLDNVRAVLPGSVITFVQESKHIKLRDRLPRMLGVSQGHEPDTANSSLLWDHSRVEVLDKSVSLAVDPQQGDEMLPRFLRRIDCKVDDALLLSAIVCHRPPPRYKHLWPAFDEALDVEVRYAPFPVVVGLDTNSLNPAALARSIGLKWAGRGIDGFMYSPKLRVVRPRRLMRTRSDHRAVMATLEVPNHDR